MRQGDGTDMLGSSDPRSASIGVIYVATDDDRQSVLTGILTQDKLGYKQVIVVLPDQNKAFQRPVDFDGLKSMRRGLKAEIIFIAPSGPGPAEYARQRRFPVYASIEAFAQSMRLESLSALNTKGSSKKRLFGFGGKEEIAGGVAVAALSNQVGQENTISTLPVNGAVNSSPNTYPSASDQVVYEAKESNGERTNGNGKHSTVDELAELGVVGDLAAHAIGEISPSADKNNNEVSHTPPTNDADYQIDEHAAEQTTEVGGESLSSEANGAQKQSAEPAIITFSTTGQRPKITRKIPVVASGVASQPDGSTSTTTQKKSNSGKLADAGVGVAAVSSVSANAGGSIGGSGGQPPSGSAPGGPGGSGVGGTSRGVRIGLAVALGILTVLLIGGITVAAIPGGFTNLPHIIPGTTATATVTITPNSKDETNVFQIIGVTGTPNPSMREVAARIISATSPSQSKTVQSTGSIPGTRARGALTFFNTGNIDQTFGSVILHGASGVPVTFNGPITVPAALPASLTITGFAVNIGSTGNIRALDISGSCCAASITVKNGTFSGGQNPQPNSVVQQSDINGAAAQLTASLTPSTEASLQKELHTGEQVVPNTLKCSSAVSANHAAGAHAPNVTVIVTVTCKEEVYDQTAALSMAANLLTKQATADLGPSYALSGTIVSEVTRVTVVDTKGTLSILVKAEGVWVYQFSDTVLQGFTNHIANMSNQAATNYLMTQPGVKAVKIDNPNGDTMPDASHIKIVVEAIPGVSGSPTPGGPGTPTATPIHPTVVPTGATTPPVKPTPTATQGLGGS